MTSIINLRVSPDMLTGSQDLLTGSKLQTHDNMPLRYVNRARDSANAP
jgi:hypothetical protein